MYDLLISSCFNRYPHFSLAALRSDGSPPHFVNLADLPANLYFRGISGLAKIPNGFVAGLQTDGPSKLLFLDESLRIKKIIDLNRVRDVHSILYNDRKLYIVSSGSDSIVIYHLDSEKEQTTWQLSTGNTDTLHINSIVMHRDKIFISMFGPTRPQTLRSGCVLSVDTGKAILEGLRHPHSLMSDGETVWILESLTGTIVRRNEAGFIDQLPGYFGYLRGLALTDSTIVVGRSTQRRRSAIPTLAPHIDHTSRSSIDRCALYIIPQTAAPTSYDLHSYFDEIYDILPVTLEENINVIDHTAPDDVQCFARALCFYRQGRLKKAIQELERIENKNAPQLTMLSRCCYEASMKNKSQRISEKALLADPFYSSNLSWMAFLLERSGNLSEALRFARDACRSNSNVAVYLIQCGDILRRLGRFDEAIPLLERAVELDPRRENARKCLSAALIQSSDPEVAPPLRDWRTI